MYIPRAVTGVIENKLRTSPKGIIIYGARQVGKTTLVNEVIQKLNLKTLVVNGDQSKYINALSSRDLSKIKDLVGGHEMLFVDEAQRVPEIGINIKIILDSLPELKVIVTGSSALDLASKISEPLTGRTWTYKLYPISQKELAQILTPFETNSQLEERLIYGSYPEIFSLSGGNQKREYLQNLSDAYLYKDLLELGGLKSSNKIHDLLRLISFQIGSEVSLTELGNNLDMSKDTVSKYIDFLEKSFVIFRLSGFSRNLRKEVSKMDKIYFYDLGVRNILIDDLKSLSNRNDTGQLWENFLITERIKKSAIIQDYPSTYFWRTYTGAELDYVEEQGEQLSGFEFKFNDKIIKAPTGWNTAYPTATYQTINRGNWQEFVK